jgi:hypothetical protein
MQTDDYIRAKQDELKNWERTLRDRGHELSQTVSAKRDDVMKRLDALQHETGERLDVLRMGFESAWAELKTAFETVAKKDLDGKH